MMVNKTLKQLEALGNVKMRAHNTRYGAGDKQFGVKHCDLRVLAKKIKKYSLRQIAAMIAGSVALLFGSTSVPAQASIDGENRYANVGVIMVWRVDESGKPVELRGFASGTLIGDRVMVTAGHFTAPMKALGVVTPSIRIFASFSPTDAKDPNTWIPVVAQATHPSMPHCPPPPQCDPIRKVKLLLNQFPIYPAALIDRRRG